MTSDGSCNIYRLHLEDPFEWVSQSIGLYLLTQLRLLIQLRPQSVTDPRLATITPSPPGLGPQDPGIQSPPSPRPNSFPLPDSPPADSTSPPPSPRTSTLSSSPVLGSSPVL